MHKKALFAVILTLMSYSSFAAKNNNDNLVVALGYNHLYFDESHIGLKEHFSAVGGALGYQFNREHFFVMPEVRVAFGISDASWQNKNTNWQLELESYAALGVKVGKNLKNSSVFLSLSYTKIDATPKSRFAEGSLNVDGDNLGIGAGAGYKFNRTLSVDFLAEYLDSGAIYSSVHLRSYLPIY